jgi:CRISPR type II-A-associated protein Csn2
MILRIKNLEVDIDFSKSDFWTLEIYNPLFLREIFESFSSEESEEGRIHRLLDGENEVDDRFIFVANPFEISGEMSLFSKKMKKYLFENFRSVEDEANFRAISSQIDDLSQEIVQNVDFSLEYDEFSFEKFLKIANFRLRESPKIGGAKQTIYDIMDLTSELSQDSVICFLNLKHLLTDEEFENILKYAFSKELKLVFLESSFGRFYSKKLEKVIVVDDDLYICEKSF